MVLGKFGLTINIKRKMNHKIAIIGLGYVGLPLARLFATKYRVIGFDINTQRINELNNCNDRTLEIEKHLLEEVVLKSPTGNESNGLYFSSNVSELKDCNIYIITVPTPIDKFNKPNLTPLIKASETVGQVLSKGDIVIYESTVYPGATEEDCIPIVEKLSGLKFNIDFFAGYSPERINPGDKEHTVEKIKKVTSGSTAHTGEIVDKLYASVITAGTHLAPSIKVAEAAKVIENAQRDINIAFVNELAKLFSHLNIDTNEVLKAAGTKWNFLNFKPGLVGGHCIGVDPYYLAQKAQEIGYHPEIILAGRRVNDTMGKFVSSEVVKLMLKSGIGVKDSNALLLGITFKENCPDIRNTKVIDIYHELVSYDINVDVYDPWADQSEVFKEYGITTTQELSNKKYDSIILAVAHEQFKVLDFEALKSSSSSVIYDIKSFIDKDLVNGTL